jgi:FtsH-binding integral membrane protein
MNERFESIKNKKRLGFSAFIIGLLFGTVWLLIGFLVSFFLKENWLGSIFSILPGVLILSGLIVAKKWSVIGGVFELMVAAGYFFLSIYNWQKMNVAGWILIIFSLIVPVVLCGIFLIIDGQNAEKSDE